MQNIFLCLLLVLFLLLILKKYFSKNLNQTSPLLLKIIFGSSLFKSLVLLILRKVVNYFFSYKNFLLKLYLNTLENL